MKKIFLLTAFIFTVLVCRAYIATIAKGNMFSLYKPMGLGTYLRDYQIIQCDTFVASMLYHKVFYCDTFGNATLLKGIIREDTVNGKIFFQSDSDAVEKLIIDYTLNTGDSFYFPYNNTFKLVDSVDYKFIHGALRRIVYFKGVGPFINQFIEGVGCSFWGVLPSSCVLDNLCYFYTQGIIAKPELCEPLGIPSVNDSELFLTLTPNPSTDKITCRLGSTPINKADYIIYNTCNTIVSRGSLRDGYIDVSYLESGMYIVDVVIGEKKYVAKLIKQ